MGEAFFEREFELDAIERMLAELAQGRSAVAVVDAAAGMGKTMLLRHARTQALEMKFEVMQARGSDLETEFAFGVVRQLFDAALPEPGPRRDAVFRDAAGEARSIFFGDEAVTGSMHLLLNGLYWLLLNLVDSRPLVVIVDDMQWVDPPSIRFLGFLARRADAGPIGLIVSSRSGPELHDPSVDEILALGDTTLLEPRGLSRAGVSQMVRGAFDLPGTEEFGEACHDATAGNPLFLRELLRILASTGVRPDSSGAAEARRAGSGAVRRRVVAGLRRRPEGVRRVASAMAVLGDDVELALVARHCDQPLAETAAAAEQLAADGLLGRTDPPAFTHAVLREAVLAATPREELSAHHDRAATILREAGRPVVNVAAHLLRTTPAQDPGRIPVLLAAAKQTWRQGSPGGAAAFLLRARDEPPPPDQRAEVSRLLGNCQGYDLALAEADRHLHEALDLARTPQQQAACAYSLGRFRGACGSPADTVDLLSKAIEALDGIERSAPVAAMIAQIEAERLAAARAALTRRTDLVGHLATYRLRPDAAAAVLGVHGSAEALFAGEPATAVAELALGALAVQPLTPETLTSWVAIHTLIAADRLEDADRILEDAANTALRLGLTYLTALIKGHQARAAFLRGDLAQAEEHVEDCADQIVAHNGAAPVLQATRVELLLEEGRLAEAADVLRGSALADAALPANSWQLWLYDARIRLHAARGDDARRYADAMAAGALYARWGATHLLELPWRLHAAEASYRMGERDHAAQLAGEHLAMARAFGSPRYTAAALRTTAAITDTPSRARPHLEEAVELLGQSDARLELARTLTDLGATLLALSDARTAVPVLQRALSLATECRAASTTRRLQELIARAGAPAPDAALTGVHALTPTERRVARLVTTGMTNREIAEHLMLSEKTIESHLSRAYRKVDVRSRTELAIQLAGLPIRS